MEESNVKPPSFLISIRFMMAIMAFFGYAMQYIQRINMSVAIVCMVNNTAVKAALQLANANATGTTNLNETMQSILIGSNASSPVDVSHLDTCMFKALASAKPRDGAFVWDKPTQGLILSAYFYGYITTQVLGGYLSIMFGAKIVLGMAILIGSILTLIVPVAAPISYVALVASRFLTGVAHGSFWPACATLWSHWAPPNERSRLAGIANAGAQIGNVIALSISGYLCENGFGGGWPSIFYVFGIMGIVWFVPWMIFTSKSPSDNRFISYREREYIMENTKEAVANAGKLPLHVIGNIFKSVPWWGITITHTASMFGTYLLLTQLPTYMKEVLKFDIKSNGGLSSLPYIVFWLVTIVSSAVGDKLIQSKKLSKTAVRKIFNTLGLLIPAVSMVGLAFVTCSNPYMGVALLTVGLGATGCAYGAGFIVNYNDIAGSYAGFSFGVANTFGTIPGFVAPYMVGIITKNQLQSEWQIVFFITAVVYVIGAVFYLFTGSGEIEPWAAKRSTEPKQLEQLIPLQENNETSNTTKA